MTRRSHSLKAEVNARIDMLSDKVRVLELLERKLAEALVAVLPKSAADANEAVLGYDIVAVVNGHKQWLWRHFIRGTRSSKKFDTRGQAVTSAKRDAVMYLAKNRRSHDLAAMLDQIIAP